MLLQREECGLKKKRLQRKPKAQSKKRWLEFLEEKQERHCSVVDITTYLNVVVLIKENTSLLIILQNAQFHISTCLAQFPNSDS